MGTTRMATKMKPPHEATTESPAAATPATLPAMSSKCDTEETSTSMIRADFSSIVLVSSICAPVKIDIHRM